MVTRVASMRGSVDGRGRMGDVRIGRSVRLEVRIPSVYRLRRGEAISPFPRPRAAVLGGVLFMHGMQFFENAMAWGRFGRSWEG